MADIQDQPEPEPVDDPTPAPMTATETDTGTLQVDDAGITEAEPEAKARSILTFTQAIDAARMSGEDTSAAVKVPFLDTEIWFTQQHGVLSVEYLCQTVHDNASAARALIDLAHSSIDKITIGSKIREINSWLKPGALVTAWEELCLQVFPDAAAQASYPSNPDDRDMGDDRSEAPEQLDDPPADS